MLESVIKIVDGMEYLFINSFEIIPKYLFVIVLLIVTLIGLYLLIKSTYTRKKKFLITIAGIYVIIGTIIVCTFPHIMEDTSSIWIVARSNYAIASLIGIVLLYIYMNLKVEKTTQKILLIVMILYLAFQYVGFQMVIRDNYIVGYQDQYMCKQIEEKIGNYEKDTGIVISKVAFYFGQDKQYTYPFVYGNKDINIKAMYTEWSRLNSLKYYMNRDLIQIEKDEEVYNQYFKEKQWKYFNDEQVILIDDTLHLFVY